MFEFISINDKITVRTTREMFQGISGYLWKQYSQTNSNVFLENDSTSNWSRSLSKQFTLDFSRKSQNSLRERNGRRIFPQTFENSFQNRFDNIFRNDSTQEFSPERKSSRDDSQSRFLPQISEFSPRTIEFLHKSQDPSFQQDARNFPTKSPYRLPVSITKRSREQNNSR